MRNVLLALLTIAACSLFLHHTQSVTLPVVFAAFLVPVLWPLHARIQRVAGRGIAAVVSLTVFLLVIAGGAWGLVASAKQVVGTLEGRTGVLEEGVEQAKLLAAQAGISLDGRSSGALDTLKRLTKVSAEALSGFVLTTAFVGLLIVEARQLGAKLASAHPRGEEAGAVVRRIGVELRRYVVVRTGVGLVTGIGCGLGSLAIGLELWWLWGATNFVLNYVPTLGSILGVVPPTVFAFVQSGGDWTYASLALGVVGGVQLVMGVWVDPLMQGKYLELSPSVVLFSVTFWGWVWGIGGALLGVPLTLVAVLLCREHDRTRWLATLLARSPSSTR